MIRFPQDTAALWKEKGQLVKPTKASGFFDFLGLGPSKDAGRSGADAENGPGLYVTDDIDMYVPVSALARRGCSDRFQLSPSAVAFANGNAKVNLGTTPAVCAIFVKSSGNWRNTIRKVFLPEKLVTDSSDPKLKADKENATPAAAESDADTPPAIARPSRALPVGTLDAFQAVLPGLPVDQTIEARVDVSDLAAQLNGHGDHARKLADAVVEAIQTEMEYRFTCVDRVRHRDLANTNKLQGPPGPS